MLKILDTDTGESEAQFVESHLGGISLQVGYVPGAGPDDEYISVYIGTEDEARLLDWLTKRRVPPLSNPG